MVGMKKEVVGLETGKYNGISYMYNVRCDPDLGIGKAACRRILCACITCLKLLETPWDKELDDQSQPRYGSMKGVCTIETLKVTIIGGW